MTRLALPLTAGPQSLIDSDARSGAQAARLGKTMTTGGDSTISQSFTVPPGASTLSFYFNNVCFHAVSQQWVTATLTDLTTSRRNTILPHTCTLDFRYGQRTAPVTAGHRYRLTVLNHDDNVSGETAHTDVDEVTLS
jgi:hypothetical protein